MKNCLGSSRKSDLQIISQELEIYSNTTRLLILDCLYEGNWTLSSIVKCIGKPYPSVTQHIRRLFDRGIVTKSNDRYPKWALADKDKYKKLRNILNLLAVS